MRNPQHTETAIADRIENLIAAKGVTRKHVMDHAGMSRSTFDRTMAGGRSFTIAQLVSIAGALGVHPAELFPPELTVKALAA